MSECRDCGGRGAKDDVTALPGLPPVTCGRCRGTGKEPPWAYSVEAWEAAFRREATEAGVSLDIQDDIVRVALPRMRKMCARAAGGG